MKRSLSLFLLLCTFSLTGQVADSLVLNFREYLGYVKKYHPIARQADLVIAIGEANLMKARGGFDPKVEVDYNRKQFKGTEYYDRLNATFKIPTWYGIELKGNFEQTEGEFLNPDETLPDDGLYSAGVSFSLGRGFLANERMATLRKAKFFREQTLADRDLLINDILFNASVAYFDWLQAYNEREIFSQFLENALIRFEGIKARAIAGDIASIDTVEAKIAYQNRALSLTQAEVNLRNKALELSNFLWMANDVPVELREGVIPDTSLQGEIDLALEILGLPLDSFTLENHPKIVSLGLKIDQLTIDKRLKTNQLLPRIDLEYNFLTETPELLNSFEDQNYKGGLNISLPLFLRKERGELKLAKFKLRDAEYEYANASVTIANKVIAIYNELDSFEEQNRLVFDIVDNYNTLLEGEERKFSFGESSLFLINSRESRLIDARLKQNELQNKYFKAKAKLFQSLAINPEGI
ncbi:Outer membrane protein TolC [Muriicola jejuensis]|uniref:TolC family protein n=1 Tax=Muriicola jejuensis TaxID=504488 RepID=A0A6P0UGD5_9FLAO|nr:TolC family protein [Muriicola jejuensis]NER10273.1 TolC family protein [Muriicola jejuensis]SMP01449.1 Outer membrane protein TolC [Muriicola jejuensis]